MTTTRDKRERRVVSAQRRIAEHKAGGVGSTTLNIPEGAEFFKFEKAGVYRIDIIPYDVGKHNPYADPGSLYFERTYYVHTNVGPSNKRFVCNKRTFGKKCAICDYQDELRNEPEADENLIKSLYPQDRQLFNIINLDSNDKKVQLLETSHFVFGKHLDAKLKSGDDSDGWDHFADLESGMSLKVTMELKSIVDKATGKIKGKPFTQVSVLDFKKREHQYDETILKQTFCLDDIPKEVDYNFLKNEFLQTGANEESDVERNGKDSSSTSTAKAPVDDEDDDVPPPAKKAPVDTEDEESGVLKAGTKVDHDDYGICEVVSVSKDGTKIVIKNAKGKEYKDISPTDIVLKEEKAPVKSASKPPVDDDDED